VFEVETGISRREWSNEKGVRRKGNVRKIKLERGKCYYGINIGLKKSKTRESRITGMQSGGGRKRVLS